MARAACGETGRRRVLRRYCWDRVGTATEAAYEKVVDARPAMTGVV
jgi:hypothetical protein